MLAMPAAMLNAVLVADASVPEVAVSVYPVPSMSMLSPGRVAMPETALIVTVPERVPPGPALFAMARVIGAEDPVTILPAASSTLTAMLPRLAPEEALAGCVRKTSLLGVPGVILNVVLTTELKPPELALKV